MATMTRDPFTEMYQIGTAPVDSMLSRSKQYRERINAMREVACRELFYGEQPLSESQQRALQHLIDLANSQPMHKLGAARELQNIGREMTRICFAYKED